MLASFVDVSPETDCEKRTCGYLLLSISYMLWLTLNLTLVIIIEVFETLMKPIKNGHYVGGLLHNLLGHGLPHRQTAVCETAELCLSGWCAKWVLLGEWFCLCFSSPSIPQTSITTQSHATYRSFQMTLLSLVILSVGKRQNTEHWSPALWREPSTNKCN